MHGGMHMGKLLAEALWPKARRRILGSLRALLEDLKRYRDSERYQQVQKSIEAITTKPEQPPSPGPRQPVALAREEQSPIAPSPL